MQYIERRSLNQPAGKWEKGEFSVIFFNRREALCNVLPRAWKPLWKVGASSHSDNQTGVSLSFLLYFLSSKKSN